MVISPTLSVFRDHLPGADPLSYGRGVGVRVRAKRALALDGPSSDPSFYLVAAARRDVA
jgi:hypothetical protein